MYVEEIFVGGKGVSSHDGEHIGPGVFEVSMPSGTYYCNITYRSSRAPIVLF
jgi:hypothetical protein